MNVAGRKMVGSTSTPAKRGLHLFERLFHPARHRQRVGPELLLDDQHQARPAVDHGIADGRRKSFDDRRNIADAQRGSVPCRHHDRFEVANRRHRGAMGDRQPLIRRVEESACLQRDAFAGGLHDVVNGERVRAEALRIDEDLQLPIALPPDRDVGDTGNRHQSRPDRPLRQRRQLDLRQRVRGDAHLHDATERRQRREHHRCAGDARKLRSGARQPFLHHLARGHHVARRIEDEHDLREAENGLRTDRAQAGDAVER